MGGRNGKFWRKHPEQVGRRNGKFWRNPRNRWAEGIKPARMKNSRGSNSEDTTEEEMAENNFYF